MNKKILFLFLLVFMIVPFISAVPPQQVSTTDLDLESAYPSTLKLGEDFYIHTHVYDTVDQVLITSGADCYYHFYNHQIDGGQHISKGNLTQYGMGYEAIVDGSLINESGEYSALVWCNISAPADRIGYNRYTMEATSTAEPQDLIQLFSRAFLIILSIILVVLIQTNSRKVNYDRWYENLAKKYEKKNWVKFGLSALGYNLMKNSWIFSYLVGLLGLLILTELTSFFNITSALEIMKIVLGLYSWSAIVVSLIFFSQVQEWIVGWLDDLQNLNWGIDKQ